MIKIYKLITKAKNGDKEAFDELALRIKGYLYSIAKTKLYNSQDIEDAVQTTLYIAYKEINTIRSPHGFKSWITTILKNECYKICRDDIKQKKVVQKMSKYTKATETEFDIDEFDTLIQSLNDKEKKILELLCKKDLTYKQIATKLNMNENTVKYYARTRLSKLRDMLSKRTAIIFIICFLIAGVVSAITIISYLKKAVSTKDVGVNNDGVLMAIENLDWYQQVDMDYKDLGDGYKIKMNYLLMDEMCLYMIFDLESEKDISKYTDVSLTDLRIVDENGNVICDKSDMDVGQCAQRLGCKLIKSDKYHFSFLVYMYAENFPVSKKLNINFSSIVLYKKDITNTISCNANISVNLLETFINRNHTNYTSNSDIIKKAVVTRTGFYAIIELNNYTTEKASLIDENNNTYVCYNYLLVASNSLRYIVVSSFNNSNISQLYLAVSNEDIQLAKTN